MQFQLSDALSILQAIVLLGGFIVGVRQLILFGEQIKLMTREIREQVEWQRKNATFDYLNVYTTHFKDTNRELEKRINLLKQDRQPISLEKMAEELKRENTRSELLHFVAYFENLAIGISHDYFDEPIAREFMYNVVVSAYESLKPYLSIRRNETGVAVASNFEKLARKWSAPKSVAHNNRETGG